MKNLIRCPRCGEEFEVSEALTHQIKDQIVSSLKEKHKIEIEKTIRETEEAVSKKVNDEKERNKKLTDEISSLLDDIRKLKERDEEREISMKKKLMDEEEKIRENVRVKVEKEHELKDLEKDKKLTDALKQIEEMKVKIKQGSQQTQGETLELEVENRLKSEFPGDTISEVKKGQRGADITHKVFDKYGRPCGTLLWESKNAQWSDGWIAKLKEDQREAKADLAILVSVNIPPDVENFSYKNGIWVCDRNHYIALAWALRFNLVSLYHERATYEGKDEKMQILYNYFTGTEFKHRVEGIVEAFGNLQEELEKEKRYFNTKWARQEKEIRKVIDQTHGMYGDLQGMVGKSLPEIKSLELDEGYPEKSD